MFMSKKKKKKVANRANVLLVSILKPDGEIQAILSQSTVVRYLFENRKQFPEIDQVFDKSVMEQA